MLYELNAFYIQRKRLAYILTFCLLNKQAKFTLDMG